jgi:hypothetical protein
LTLQDVDVLDIPSLLQDSPDSTRKVNQRSIGRREVGESTEPTLNNNEGHGTPSVSKTQVERLFAAESTEQSESRVNESASGVIVDSDEAIERSAIKTFANTAPPPIRGEVTEASEFQVQTPPPINTDRDLNANEFSSTNPPPIRNDEDEEG